MAFCFSATQGCISSLKIKSHTKQELHTNGKSAGTQKFTGCILLRLWLNMGREQGTRNRNKSNINQFSPGTLRKSPKLSNLQEWHVC
jgi:hypothetical protein